MDGVDVNMRISSGLQDERSSGFWLAKTTASADVSAAVAQGRLPCIYRLLGGATGPVGAQKVGADAKRLVLNEKSKRRKTKTKKQKKSLFIYAIFRSVFTNGRLAQLVSDSVAALCRRA